MLQSGANSVVIVIANSCCSLIAIDMHQRHTFPQKCAFGNSSSRMLTIYIEIYKNIEIYDNLYIDFLTFLLIVCDVLT
jgi:hypothetical protein